MKIKVMLATFAVLIVLIIAYVIVNRSNQKGLYLVSPSGLYVIKTELQNNKVLDESMTIVDLNDNIQYVFPVKFREFDTHLYTWSDEKDVAWAYSSDWVAAYKVYKDDKNEWVCDMIITSGDHYEIGQYGDTILKPYKEFEEMPKLIHDQLVECN